MVDLSVIILTFNEEQNIDAALDSVVGWAKEVFVVDSFSTDSTVDKVLERNDPSVHIVQHSFENYSAQWNWALTKLPLNSAWTLKLDADERVTKEFRDEVGPELSNESITGIYFRRKMYFMGKPMMHGGYSTTYVLHCWRTGQAIFEDRAVNEHVILDGEKKHIEAFIDHYDFKSLTDWIEKHNRYSSMEAQCLIDGNTFGGVEPKFLGNPDQHRMWLRLMYRKLPLRHFIYFLYRYLKEKAILDGSVGFRYCLLHAVYRYWIDLKYYEYLKLGKTPTVNWPTRGGWHPSVENSELQKMVDVQ